MSKKKDDDTTPKAFRHWDPPGPGRKLVRHVYDTEIPLCQRLIDRVGLTDEQMVKLAEFMRECITSEGPKSENRFLKAGGEVAGVMITTFPFVILGSLPKNEDVAFWADMQEEPKKKSTTRRKKRKAK